MTTSDQQNTIKMSVYLKVLYKVNIQYSIV